MLGEPAPAGLVAHGVPGALLLNLILTLPGLRADPPAVPAARARRPHPRGAPPWLTASAPSRRFLPGDPRVAEPYRLTPQLALRVAVLGFFALALFAVLFLRLWALQVLSGDRYLAQANDNRVRTLRARGAARPDPRSQRPCARRRTRPARASSSGRATCRRRGRRSSRSCGSSPSVTGVPTKEIVAELAKHGNDPLTPVVVQRGIKQQQIYYLLEHQDEFPGVRLADELPAQVPVPVARRAGARLRRPDLARGLQGAEEEGLPGERLDRPVGDRARRTTRISAARTARRS